MKETLESPPEWLGEWSGQVGAALEDGLREETRAGLPSHARTPPSTTPIRWQRPTRSSRRTTLPARPGPRQEQPAEPRAWRKDEYPRPVVVLCGIREKRDFSCSQLEDDRAHERDASSRIRAEDIDRLASAAHGLEAVHHEVCSDRRWRSLGHDARPEAGMRVEIETTNTLLGTRGRCNQRQDDLRGTRV